MKLASTLGFGFLIALAGSHLGAAQSVSVPPPYCKQSNLSGPAFLNLLNKIIKHGDLTDTEFLQNALRTKLNERYGTKLDGSLDHSSLYFHSDMVMGNPISVDLSIIAYSGLQTQPGIAMLAFTPTPPNLTMPNFFMNCLKLTQNKSSSFFESQVSEFRIQIFSAGAVMSAMLNDRGKNNAVLKIKFGLYSPLYDSYSAPYSDRRPQDAAVEDIIITQSN